MNTSIAKNEGIRKHLSKIVSYMINKWQYILIFIISLVFFYPSLLLNKIPLPADALVGAHTPWIELKWADYPAGVPIKNLEITDAISQFYPWRSLVGKYWRDAKLPLWNEYMFSGSPFLASWHSASLYPLNILYVLMSDAKAWTLLIYFQILLSALFACLFFNSIGISKSAAFFGGIIFAFSGYMVAWLEFTTGGHAGLWLPILLFFEYKLLKTPRNLYIGIIALLFFFIYTAGDFQIPFYVTFTYLFFGAYILIKEYKKTDYLKVVKRLISGLILGIIVSSVQLLPSFELFFNSIRTNDPYISSYNYGLLDWSKILNFIWPDFFGNVVTGNYWGRFGYHEYLAFTGVVSLVFLIYSLLKRKTNVEIAFWIILVISIIMLFPNPISRLPFKLKIPGLGTSSASRMIFLTDFCIATLAAFGFSKWLKNFDNLLLKKVLFYIIVFSFGILLGLVINIYLFSLDKVVSDNLPLLKNIKVSAKNIIPSTLVVAMIYFFLVLLEKVKLLGKVFYKRSFVGFFILSLSIIELLLFAWKNTPFSPDKFVFPTTKTIDFLTQAKKPFRIAGPGIPLNYFMYYGISSAEGYDSLYPLNNAEWYSLVNAGDLSRTARRYGEIGNYTSPLLDYANIKYIVDYKKNPDNKIISDEGQYSTGIVSEKYKQVFSEGRIGVFENETVLPKVWLTRDYEVIEDKSKLIKTLANNRSEKKIYLERSPGVVFGSGPFNYAVNDFKQYFNTMSMNISTNEDAMLFISESFSKGWIARIDNEPVRLMKANFLFMSVIIPSGNHELKLEYYPDSIKAGLWLSLLGIVGVFFTIRSSYNNIDKSKKS